LRLRLLVLNPLLALGLVPNRYDFLLLVVNLVILIRLFVVVIRILINLAHIFMRLPVLLLVPLVPRCNIRRHLATSRRRDINDSLLLSKRFTGTPRALINSSATVEVTIISAALICFARVQVFNKLLAVGLVASVLVVSYVDKVRTSVS
jgi:hypothetical protein